MTTEQQINHHERARRLAEYIDTLSHLREDWPDNYDDAVDMDGEIPVVSYRFVTNQWDGSEASLMLGHTLEDCVGGVGDFGGEYPWVPGEFVLDLDTGWEYELFTDVTARRRTWELSWTMVFEALPDEDHAGRRHHVKRRFACTEAEARAEEQKLTTEYLANTAEPAAEDVKLERIAPDEETTTLPAITGNGFDPYWVLALNNALEDRADEDGQPITIDDIDHELWDDFIGPMLDRIVERSQ